MAKKEHLKMLKQGVDAWNAWRADLPLIGPDLEEADLEGADLEGADLNGADLGGAFLFKANLVEATLQGADLEEGNLERADLGGVDLFEANLQRANLRGAFLYRAYLAGANFEGANLRQANFERADLGGANLERVDFRWAILEEVGFNNVDLSTAIGLEECLHRGPSSVDYRTIARSNDVPLVFWRGCGLPDALIDYMPSLSGDAIQFYSCFVSYSSTDQEFAERLHADLQNNGVRCWFAPNDMRTGDRIRDTIDQQIRVHDKLLLILSSGSVVSNWVESEVETAIEKEMGREAILFPLRIDASIDRSDVAWARMVKRRHITDFSGWKDHDSYQKAFQRILRDLKP